MLLLQIAAAFVVAQHLLPDQFGITVLGNGTLLIANAIRDLGAAGYFVQQRTLTLSQIRSAFTLSLLVTILVSLGLLALSAPLATFYDDDRLAAYIRVMTLGFALAPFAQPVTSLLARDMRFGSIAILEVGSGLAYAVLAMVLVKFGVGVMTLAWATVGRGAVSLVLALVSRRDLRIFRPSLRDWRDVLSFGLHGSLTAVVYNLGEALLYLGLGKVMDARAVGLIQRSYILTQIPERVLLAGVGAVALPAFSELARRDEPITPAYLYSVTLVTPIYLSAMLVQVPLARPLVLLLLGPQWLETVPLIQIIAAGHLLGFAGILNITALIAAGGIRQTTPLALIQMGSLLGTVFVAAPYGSLAIAWTAFVNVPVSAVASFLFLRTRLAFSWRELLAAITPGAVAMLASMAGPLLVGAMTDWLQARPLLGVGASLVLGAIPWFAVLAIVRHPLIEEAARSFALLRRQRPTTGRT